MPETIFQIKALTDENQNLANGTIYTDFNTAKKEIKHYIDQESKMHDQSDNQIQVIDYGYGTVIIPAEINSNMDLIFGMSAASSEIHAYNISLDPAKQTTEYLPYDTTKPTDKELSQIPHVIIPLTIANSEGQIPNVTEDQILKDFGYFDLGFRKYSRITDDIINAHALRVNNPMNQTTVAFGIPKSLKDKSDQEIIDHFYGQFMDGYFENGIYKDNYNINFDSSRKIQVIR